MSLGAAILVRARPPGSGRRAERATSADRSGEHAQGTSLPSRPPLRTTGATVEAYDAATGATVEAYDAATGRARWTYARQGHRPLAVLPARGTRSRSGTTGWSPAPRGATGASSAGTGRCPEPPAGTGRCPEPPAGSRTTRRPACCDSWARACSP
ncbi:hypothetical protein [Streptomyces sp. NPDC006333]|uniref:hypothetical protein n=1 Tax=Streptomyces sp. NPDC006333 TaxID=3156753 RepID=UPI0033B3BDE7